MEFVTEVIMQSVTEVNTESVTEVNTESVTESSSILTTEETTEQVSKGSMTDTDTEPDLELTEDDHAELTDTSDDYKDFMPDVSELENSTSPGNHR